LKIINKGFTQEVYAEQGIKSSDDMGHYRWMLNLIDHNGSLLDMGSGCGYLAEYIMNHSLYKIIPHGIDLCEKSIEQAKEILVEYKDNFKCVEIENYFFKKHFDYIIFSPIYIPYYELREVYNRCWAALNDNGKIIIKFPPKSFEEFNKRGYSVSYLKKKNLKWFKFDNLWCGHITKEKFYEV